MVRACRGPTVLSTGRLLLLDAAGQRAVDNRNHGRGSAGRKQISLRWVRRQGAHDPCRPRHGHVALVWVGRLNLVVQPIQKIRLSQWSVRIWLPGWLPDL